MRRYRFMIALGLALAALAVAGVACSSSKSTKTNATSTPKKTAVSTPVATRATQTPQASTPRSTASSQTTPSGSTTVMKGNSPTAGSILVDSESRTLYKFKNDQPNVSNCNDTCAQLWPPLTISGGTPTGISGLGAIQRSDGTNQVTLDGAPLYRFANDAAPGDAKGDGFAGLWSVAVKFGG